MSFKILLTTLISLFLVNSLVLAVGPGGIPHQFYGTVTVNGNPASDGTIVSARIDNKEVATTTTAGGKYGYSPVFYVDDPDNNRAGKTINFFVNGIDTGQTAIFSNGKSTELDLSITVATVTPPSGPSSSGGGNGGGGGSGGGTTPLSPPTSSVQQTEEPEACEERWTCTEWSSCKDGLETRTCTDPNNCGTDLNKPFESQPCSTVETEKTSESSTPTFSFTGMFSAITGNLLYATLVALFLAGAAGFAFYRTKFSKSKSKRRIR